ncbi:MAG: hypothetical protein HYX93_03665 [Chloroflexi bacterium]|nr:hypothetical protein [Chloroflexota bacterium]
MKAPLRWAIAAVGTVLGALIGTIVATDSTNWLGLGPVGALVGALVLGPLLYHWLEGSR